ncbi:MAG: peptidylprolyl isomerase [Phycisphaeraceae bacterium]
MRNASHILSLMIVTAFAAACQSTPRNSGEPDRDSPGANRLAPDVPAAYLDTQPIGRDALYRVMLEAQGGEALAELLLDRAVERRLREAGVALAEADLRDERDKLLRSLSPDADEAARLLHAMRDERGLGPERYDAMLRRNSGLRRLVRDAIVVNEPAIRQAYDLRFGDRYTVRLITADAVDTLSRARRRAIDGASFTELAIELSTDESARQGGLLSPISPSDATYPKAIRDALPKLSVDSEAARLSSIVALPEGFALVRLESIDARDAPPLDAVRGELEQLVRLELERVRMQQLARVLIEETNVVTLDPALEKAWRRHRESLLGR